MVLLRISCCGLVDGKPTTTRYPDTLPVHLTPFVGRQADPEKLLAILHNPSVRLVTNLGAGGIGKTRLVNELARALQDQFQQGVVFISLAQLSYVDELLPAIAGALGFEPTIYERSPLEL